MKNTIYYTYLFVALFVTMLFSQQKVKAQYAIPAKMNWWYESRFGMFIHFGSYSYLAQGEWAMSTGWTKTDYQTDVSANFNPTSFNAGTIARLAKKAGMKYIVITAKHHEGFCMWDTQVESFKDVTGTKDYDLSGFTAFNTRDILKELKDSCDAVGVKFCLYYSILDWNHPSQEISRGNDSNGWYTYSTLTSDSAKTNYIRDMKTQLKELIDNYHPAILWFDGDWTYNYGDYTYGVTSPDKWWTKADGEDLQNYLRGLDPNLLMNERVFRSAGLGDWDCSEGSILATANSRPWETCQTMNNSWGYNSGDNQYKTTKALILELVQNVSRDGNYLLNIGPKGDGTVPNESVEKLDSIGDWMAIYGESIYGTTRSPFSTEPEWGLYTKKAGKLYTHVFSWPANGLLEIPSLTNTINKIYLLNDTTNLLSFIDSSETIRISVPVNAPNPINSIVVIDVTGVPNASPQWIAIPGKIEAEDFTSNSGMQAETTGDVGGGQNLGYIDDGDWVEYAIENKTSKTDYQISFRLAAPSIGGIIDFYIDDISAGSVTTPNTGNWQVYESVVKDISITQGKHYLKVVATKSGFNFNYMEIQDKQTGIEKVSEANVNIYPNPVSNELIINSADFQYNKIEIFDAKGNLLITWATAGEPVLRIPVDLSDGMYFVKISNEKQYQLKNFIVTNN